MIDSQGVRPIVMGIAALGLSVTMAGCVGSRTPVQQGLVEDPATGHLYGSVIEKNIITDPSFYKNPKIKLRLRNTSGDTAFDMKQLAGQIRDAYESAGYETASGNDFGILVDVNVMYSGQIQTSLADEFAFLGAAGGGVAGAQVGTSNADIAAGAVSGATLGAVIGSFVTQDTYIVVARASFGVVRDLKKSRKTVTFSRSEKVRNIDDPDDEKVILKRFKQRSTTGIAVYAGGTNVAQSDIAADVRQRLARILGDFI